MLGLVDLESTHNFISESASIRFGLKVAQRSGFQVAVENGKKVTSSGICKLVQIQIENEVFNIDLFIIPLEGFDVVLGVKWLQTLGPIL